MDIKKDLRQRIKKLLLNQSPAERQKKSIKIQKKLFGLGIFKKARCVAFYVSLPEEVDTVSMILKALKKKKRVVVPRTHRVGRKLSWHEVKDLKRDLKPGVLGILEPNPQSPIPMREIDCVVVPGLVFDSKGRRLGRGAGYYDRFLETLDKKIPKIGLAFSFQLISKVPQESHDQILDRVITD